MDYKYKYCTTTKVVLNKFLYDGLYHLLTSPTFSIIASSHNNPSVRTRLDLAELRFCRLLQTIRPNFNHQKRVCPSNSSQHWVHRCPPLLWSCLHQWTVSGYYSHVYTYLCTISYRHTKFSYAISRLKNNHLLYG